jgi:hypothetical protein
MMWVEVEWDRLDDDLKSLLVVSDVWEQQMARDIILSAIDPIPMTALGPSFSFEDREPIGGVPHPCAQVDLGKAWEAARIDAETCRDLLNEDNSIEAALIVYRNTIGWLRFWALRFPNERWRDQFERQLEVREKGLRRLKGKAKLKFEIEMMQVLETV